MEISIVEKKMLAALQMVQGYLTQRYLERREYLFLMDTVKIAIQAGINKQYGCVTGLHADRCTCTPNQEGQSFDYLKYTKKNLFRRREEKQ